MGKNEITKWFSNKGSRNEVRQRIIDDLAQDLKSKKAESEKKYARLYELIRRIYECDDVSDIEMAELHFSVGLPVDHILKIIKWFFIEQDIRYWNYSGRAMFWNSVPKP